MASFPSRAADDLHGWSGLSWDIDGDGLFDLALGAPANNNVGAVHVYYSAFVQQ
jgi:hypothetical protein